MRLMEMIKLKPLTVAQGSWGGNFRWDSAKLHREGAIEAQTIYDTEARAHRRGEFAGVRAARRARDSRRLLHANTLSGTYQRPMPTTIRHIPVDTSRVQDFRGRYKPQLSATGANALRRGIGTDSRLAGGARYKKTTPKLLRKLVAARIGGGRLKMSTDAVWGNLMEMITPKPLTVARGSDRGAELWGAMAEGRRAAIRTHERYEQDFRNYREKKAPRWFAVSTRRTRDAYRLTRSNTASGVMGNPLVNLGQAPTPTRISSRPVPKEYTQTSVPATRARYKVTTRGPKWRRMAEKVVKRNLRMSTDDVWGNLLESPRWARNFEQLSKAAQKKLMRRMPAGTSRQVSTGRARVLGDGAEKVVYKSVTGGKGESATAVARSKPLVPHFITTPAERSLDGTSPHQRYALMKQLEKKGVGVRMYAEHPQGYTMERMRPVGPKHAAAVTKLARRLRRRSTSYQGLDNSHPDYPHATMNFSSGPRTLADMSHANIMVDRKGRAKLTDPLFFRPKDLNRVSEAEYLPGGKAEGRSASEFSREQLRMGRKVEMEHTRNPRIATEIAKDHLAEIKDYYTRLRRMERQAKRGRRR